MRRMVLAGALAALVIHGASVLGGMAALGGNRDLELLAAISVVPLAIVAVVLVAFLPLLAFARTRDVAKSVIVACVAYLVVAAMTVTAGSKWRVATFARAANNAEPLLQAIHRFEDDHGRPPAELDELVPRYLSRIPGTGIPAYPQFGYEAGPYVPQLFPGSRWTVWIDASSAREESLYYIPSRAYRHDEQRVGKWAYRIR